MSSRDHLARILRTLIIVGLSATALGLLLVGPRASDDDPRDVVIVDYWEKWTGDEGRQLMQIVDEFNQTVGREKGIYVRCVSTSQIAQKTLIATAAGVPPDIAGVWDNTLPQLAALDALEPLDELAAEYGIGPHTYKKVYWDACVFDGKLVALVSTPAAIALHMNTKLVSENADKLLAAGLDPTRPPKTIEELDAWSRALTVIDDSGRLVRSGHMPLEPGWFLVQLPFWFGGSLYNEAERRFTLTDPQVVKAFEWIQSYSKWLGKDAVADFRSGLGNFDSPQNAFLSGKVLIVQQGPWTANFIRNWNPTMAGGIRSADEDRARPLAERKASHQWMAAPFPTAVPGLENVSYAGFDALVIPRGAKHKREAFEFIAYLQRRDVHEKLNMLHCKNSALADVSDEFLNHHPNPFVKVFEDLARSPNARGIDRSPLYSVMVEEINTLIQRIALLQVEPADGLAQSQQRLQAKLDLFYERQRLRKGGEQ